MTPRWIEVRWFLNISTASGWLSGDVILGRAAPVCAVPCVSVWVYLYSVVHSVRTKLSRKASGLIVRKWSKDNILFTWWSEAVLAGTPALPSTLSPPRTLTSPCFFSVSFQFRNSRKEFVWQLSMPSYWQPRLFFEKPKEKITCWSLSFF